jgi:O-antigen/teichoic acid export membrane protein
LAKFLEPERFGLYGLLAATIGYAIYAVGFEFYAFSIRALIGSEAAHWRGLIRDQAAFYGVAYCVLLPLLVLLCASGLLPWAYAPWLVLLVVLEHVAQELNRILIAIGEPVRASIVLFLRSGLWCLIVVVVMWLAPTTRTIEFVLGSWAIGAALACALGLLRISRFERSVVSSGVDWRRVIRGVRIAVPFLIASLAVRGMFTVDRYWVETSAGLEVLGAYVLFIGLAMAVLSFLDAAVVDFLYPKVVASAKQGDEPGFRRHLKTLAANVVVGTAILVTACWLLSEPLLRWLDRSIYSEHLFLLKWLLLAVALYALSTIPHVALYARGRDNVLVLSQVAGFVAFVVGCALWASAAGVMAVPWALCVGFAVVLAWKLIAFLAMRGVLKVTVIE